MGIQIIVVPLHIEFAILTDNQISIYEYIHRFIDHAFIFQYANIFNLKIT